MRFDSVTAYAFGPFEGQTLEFSPGLNVVFGPNEAGKSTWHAALYAALCGVRRGRGKSKEEADFQDRHCPWDDDKWEVGTRITLDGGRRVELHHDLKGRVKCSAIDLDFGRDVSDEIISDGAPDGSKWLGLDRTVFVATACVRQADLLGIVESATALQVYLQRAAASAAVDTTVAEAIAGLDRFADEQVGTTRANSQKPLRKAVDLVAVRERELRDARVARASFDELSRTVDSLAAEADRTNSELRRLIAAAAARDLSALELRLKRANELSDQFTDGPPLDPDDDQLALEVASVLATWRVRPALLLLDGTSATDLEHKLSELPESPVGDVEEHESVKRAADGLEIATLRLRMHQENRLSNAPAPDTAGLDADRLRDLARDLETSLPDADPALVAKLDHATAQSDSLSKKAIPALTLVGGVIAAIGVISAAAGLLVPGLAILFVGLVVAAWSYQAHQTARLRAVVEVGAARQALERQQPGRDAAVEVLEKARREVRARSLPDSPTELRQLGDRARQAANAREVANSWQASNEALLGQVNQLAADLELALVARGAEVAGDDVNGALDTYRNRCRLESEIARCAALRPGLEQQIENRRRLEETALSAKERRNSAESSLRLAAAKSGLTAETDEDLADGLTAWQDQHAGEQSVRRERSNSWNELQRVLDGRTIDQLCLDVQERRAQVSSLADGFDPDELATTVLEDDVDAQIGRLRQAAIVAAREYHAAQGTLEERERSLASVAEAEELLTGASAELTRVKQLDETLRTTRDFLQRATERTQRLIAPRLAKNVRDWLPTVTCGRYSDAIVDPDTLIVSLSGKDGPWRNASLLSHGTAEQVYLLLRVAMAEHLTKTGEHCPLILDDVTIQSDHERTQAILECLHIVSRDRQIILFTLEEEVLAWAEANFASPSDRIIKLDRELVPV